MSTARPRALRHRGGVGRRAVASAQATLDGARETLRLKQDVLLQRAQAALAYARVYAETDEALSTQLDGVEPASLDASTARGGGLVLSAEPPLAPRPRGRPRKARVAEPPVEALVLPAE